MVSKIHQALVLGIGQSPTRIPIPVLGSTNEKCEQFGESGKSRGNQWDWIMVMFELSDLRGEVNDEFPILMSCITQRMTSFVCRRTLCRGNLESC